MTHNILEREEEMYSQIYNKKVTGTGVVTFPNHMAIEQMKRKNDSHTIEQMPVECCNNSKSLQVGTDELLLLCAFICISSPDTDCSMFPLVAATLLCI